MGFPHSELVVFGTLVLAGVVGTLWLMWRPSDEEAAEEALVLRFPPRTRALRLPRAHEGDEPAPESGVRIKAGARVRQVDFRRGR